jgi:hypothetical protein
LSLVALEVDREFSGAGGVEALEALP